MASGFCRCMYGQRFFSLYVKRYIWLAASVAKCQLCVWSAVSVAAVCIVSDFCRYGSSVCMVSGFCC